MVSLIKNVTVNFNTLKLIYETDILTKEDVALYLQVKECQVEQVFMELNKKGILGQEAEEIEKAQEVLNTISKSYLKWMSEKKI